MKVLITGAAGFIGSFLVEKALAEGMDVWAGVRATSSRRYLGDSRISFIELDLCDADALERNIAQAKSDFGAWDVVVHAAGITKSRSRHGFFEANYRGTRNLVEALRHAGAVPSRFIYISSLSVYGAVREQRVALHKAALPYGLEVTPEALDATAYEPIRVGDALCPDTAYGMSKAAAENYLRSLNDFPWVIFRPTGVYGPRERDYYLMARSIKNHVDCAVGFNRQEITFVYVKDVADAVFAAMSRDVTGRTYLLSDGYSYNSRTFSRLLQEAMGVSGVLHLTAPLWLVRAVCAVSQTAATATGSVTTLNLDKYRILRQRNWTCDISAAVDELGYRPRYDLRRGVQETVAWYKKEQWI